MSKINLKKVLQLIDDNEIIIMFEYNCNDKEHTKIFEGKKENFKCEKHYYVTNINGGLDSEIVLHILKCK